VFRICKGAVLKRHPKRGVRICLGNIVHKNENRYCHYQLFSCKQMKKNEYFDEYQVGDSVVLTICKMLGLFEDTGYRLLTTDNLFTSVVLARILKKFCTHFNLKIRDIHPTPKSRILKGHLFTPTTQNVPQKSTKSHEREWFVGTGKGGGYWMDIS